MSDATINKYADPVIVEHEFVIETGQTLSNVINLRGTSIFSILKPPVATGTLLTVLCSNSLDGAFKQVRRVDGTVLTVDLSDLDEWQNLDPIETVGFQYIQLESDATEVGDRVFPVHAGRIVG